MNECSFELFQNQRNQSQEEHRVIKPVPGSAVLSQVWFSGRTGLLVRDQVKKSSLLCRDNYSLGMTAMVVTFP
jgi:hypothetical protein